MIDEVKCKLILLISTYQFIYVLKPAFQCRRIFIFLIPCFFIKWLTLHIQKLTFWIRGINVKSLEKISKNHKKYEAIFIKKFNDFI